MLAMEQILCELNGDEELNEQGLPPGFRFHPTDEELITFYLASKVFKGSFSGGGVEIAEVDLNRCEPWELPDVAKMGEREWYLYSLRDRKYPTGLRTNRATGSGYWKATGKDREVYSAASAASASSSSLLGMKKTLVFYKGRAPRGEKTKWVMHEYRLHTHFYDAIAACKLQEEWVICRIFHKNGEKKLNPMLGSEAYLVKSAALSMSSSSRPTCYNTCNNSSLPPLLEKTTTTPTTLILECESQATSAMQQFQAFDQNPFHNQPDLENHDLKKRLIMSSVVSQSSSSSSSSLLSSINNVNPISISNAITYTTPLFKSLLSHQDSTVLKEQQHQHQHQHQHQQCEVFKQFRGGNQGSFTTTTHLEPNSSKFIMDMMKMEPNDPAAALAGCCYHHQQYPLFFEMECSSSSTSTQAMAAAELSTSIAFHNQTMLDPNINNNILHAHHHPQSWPLDA